MGSLNQDAQIAAEIAAVAGLKAELNPTCSPAYVAIGMGAVELALAHIDRLTAERDAAVADAGRWRHITEELDRSYGDGYTEPKERCIVLEWQQGPWIRDGSNGGAGRPDTFPGWNSIVDEMMAETRRVLAELDHDDCAEGSA